MEREKIAPGKENPSYLPDKGGVKATRGFAAVTRFVQPDNSGQTASNGLPAQLKSGLEGLSGLPMDDVRVNYNSPAPRQVGALAYAKGNQIHLGPGQEKHLPHEAWHVVQQKQGRVAPSVQLKGGEYINNDIGLEKEADVMGSKAMQMKRGDRPVTASGYVNGNVLQRVTEVGTGKRFPHLTVMNMQVSGIDEVKEKSVEDETKDEEAPSGAKGGLETKEHREPLIIEVNERKKESAISKIENFASSGLSSDLLVAFIIGINAKDLGKDEKIQNELKEDALVIANYLEEKKLDGGAIPYTWKPTEPEKPYSFPFFEARSLLTVHDGAKKIHEKFKSLSSKRLVVRSMDEDVTFDPLIPEVAKPKPKGGAAKGKKSKMKVVDEEKSLPPSKKELIASIKNISRGNRVVVSGGYDWNENDDKIDELEGIDDLVKKAIKEIIVVINTHEHLVRAEIASTSDIKSIYWPEPNTYMDIDTRYLGANAMYEHKDNAEAKTQQRESTYYVSGLDHKKKDKKGKKELKGVYNDKIRVKKPLKDYFSRFFRELRLIIIAGDIAPKTISQLITHVRQSHLNPSRLKDYLVWNNDNIAPKDEEQKWIEGNELKAKKHLAACVVLIGDIIKAIPSRSRAAVKPETTATEHEEEVKEKAPKGKKGKGN